MPGGGILDVAVVAGDDEHDVVGQFVDEGAEERVEPGDGDAGLFDLAHVTGIIGRVVRE